MAPKTDQIAQNRQTLRGRLPPVTERWRVARCRSCRPRHRPHATVKQIEMLPSPVSKGAGNIFSSSISRPCAPAGLSHNVCVYDGCGIRSCVLSHVPKRNIKTKLQFNTSPAAGINTLLPACGVSLVNVSAVIFLPSPKSVRQRVVVNGHETLIQLFFTLVAVALPFFSFVKPSAENSLSYVHKLSVKQFFYFFQF